MAFNLQLALNGALVGLQVSDDKLADNTGLLTHSSFRDLFAVTISGKHILVDESGKVKICVPADSRFADGVQLHVIEKELSDTQTPAYGPNAHVTRSTLPGESNTVQIRSLTPRDNFALYVLNSMIQDMDTPETVDDANILFYCRAAYRWAHGMMSAAADARLVIEEDKEDEEGEEEEEQNT